VNLIVIAQLVLAENNRAEAFVKGFRAGNSHTAFGVCFTIAAVGLLILTVAYVVQRFTASRERGRYYSEGRLFQDLCRLHRLDLPATRCLWQLVRKAKLAHAAEVFVRPDLFHAEPTSSRRSAELLERLRGKLFPH